MDPNLDINQRSTAELLLQGHEITQEQYNALKTESTNASIDIDELLAKKKLVSDETFYEYRAKLLNVPFISIATLPLSPEALTFIPKAVAERFVLLPFGYDKEKQTLSIAMANPLDLEAINFVKQKTGLTIIVFQGVPSEIGASIGTQYSFGLIGDVKQALKETERFTTIKTFDQQSISEVIKEAPIAKIVSTILEYAMKSRASDIHVEPMEERVRVRYRIDGILYERLSLPLGVREAVISRIKILSGMKIDEHRIPQDGRFNFKFGEEEVDLRVSVLPTTFGEKIVLRLLKKSGGVATMAELGLKGAALKTLEAAILRPHGIIIVCGPTGSGKTTTLYSVLSKLNTAKVNILTLEDPVEYQIGGANQVQVNPDVGLTFASGLRSFLRQDPNIILVGEIRDSETAGLAIQAALTGHLVFSTLHTSTAAGTLPRLIDMGAEAFLLSSTINAVVGQRIARKICNDCRVSYPIPESILKEMITVLGPLFPKSQEPKLFKGKGCQVCGLSGYHGRIGIFEVMPITDKVAQLILQKTDATTIERQAVTEGMITMKQDGYLKVLEGISTLDEILRVAQD